MREHAIRQPHGGLLGRSSAGHIQMSRYRGKGRREREQGPCLFY